LHLFFEKKVLGRGRYAATAQYPSFLSFCFFFSLSGKREKEEQEEEEQKNEVVV